VFVDFDCIRKLWPEIILMVAATWIYLGATLQNNRAFWTVFSLIVYSVVGAIIVAWEGAYWADSDPSAVWFVGPILVDYVGYTLRLLVLLLGVLFTLVASQAISSKLSGEYLATLMLLVVGLMLVARANDLVMVFVSLELISIPTYVLIYLGRHDRATSEAAVKYFFLSLLASGFLLYGLSFLYGISGTTTILASGDQPAILHYAAGVETTQGVAKSLSGLAPFALVLIVAGLGFKMAVVPFHFYAPDVYQGANNANAGLLAVAPKLAGAIIFIRLLITTQPGGAQLGWQLTLVLALLTMTLGNVCALWQQNLRRMMAYSSIAHAGYILIGLSAGFAGDNGGVGAALLYLFVYALGSLGFFAALASLSNQRREVSDMDELVGLGSARPAVAAAIAVFMFSLAGIPPLAGFWGKLGLFSSAIRTALVSGDASTSSWFVVLAVGGAINAAIAAAYYLRVVSVMYFRSRTAGNATTDQFGATTAMFACAVLLVSVGVFPRAAVNASRTSGSVIERVAKSSRSLPNQIYVARDSRSDSRD